MNPDAKIGFENGKPVLVTDPPEAVEPQREPDARELAHEMMIHAMSRIITKRGHHASDRTAIAALLVLQGYETVESAAEAIGKRRTTVKKAIARAKKELQHFSASKPLANIGDSPENAGHFSAPGTMVE
ncbi:MAG: hypothetical protein ACLQAH_16780 [Limisphaerales bacterium]